MLDPGNQPAEWVCLVSIRSTRRMGSILLGARLTIHNGKALARITFGRTAIVRIARVEHHEAVRADGCRLVLGARRHRSIGATA